jgi:hypothetical protein
MAGWALKPTVRSVLRPGVRLARAVLRSLSPVLLFVDRWLIALPTLLLLQLVSLGLTSFSRFSFLPDGMYGRLISRLEKFHTWMLNKWLAKKRFWFEVDIWLGRKINGNDACLSNRVLGRLRTHRASSRLKPATPTESFSDPRAEVLRTNGFVTVEQPYTAEVLRSLRSEYLMKIQDENASMAGSAATRMILASSRNLPLSRHLINDDVARIIRSYFRSHFRVWRISAYRNLPLSPEMGAKKEIYSNHWHCDRVPTDIVGVFVTLCDVSENHGPFHIVNVDRTRQLMQAGFRDRADYGLPTEVMEDSRHVVKLTGPMGRTMIWRVSDCLHRASIPQAGCSRDMIMIHVVPSGVPLPEDWLDQVELSDLEQLALQGQRRDFSAAA